MVFRELLFRVDQVLEVICNEPLNLLKRNEGRLDMVGLVEPVLSASKAG